MADRARIAILVGAKGRGTNMSVITAACLAGDVPADVVLVVSPRDDTPAVQRARILGVPTLVLDPREPDYAARLTEALNATEVNFVCLAGYTWLLPATLVSRYRGRLLNVHPALLPKFGGKGMYGLHVHAAVIAARETESGCTVHQVTEAYDEGEVVLQLRCPVQPEDTPESLAARILSLEHEAYPEALRRVLAVHA